MLARIDCPISGAGTSKRISLKSRKMPKKKKAAAKR